jgi:Uma2 family endonuclease
MASVLTIPEPVSDDPILRRKMSLAEFNALPDDPEVDRFLLFGELWELPMTKRNRWHSGIEARLVYLLSRWCDERGNDDFEVYSGEVGCDLPDQPSGVGIDVAVFAAETIAAQELEEKYIVGAPVLAVEVLSPSDTQELMAKKSRSYLDGGVKLLWWVDPDLETITVLQPDAEPVMLRKSDEMNGDPHLPGLRFRVATVFE